MRQQRLLRWAERAFLLVSCLTLSVSALVYIEACLFQASQRGLFENTNRIISAGSQEKLRGGGRLSPAPKSDGFPISRIEIPRLGVSVVVVEGVSPRDLRIAVGHIPGTAFPGESGNIGIAGHRDTFFRPLAGIRERDTITLDTLHGSFYYLVESTDVVDPGNVQVLERSSQPILTLITCYPFYYVGPAPKRFVVKARQEMVHVVIVDPQRLPNWHAPQGATAREGGCQSEWCTGMQLGIGDLVSGSFQAASATKWWMRRE